MTEPHDLSAAAALCRQGAAQLESMRAAAAQGRPPSPAELAVLRGRAQAQARVLARSLSLDQGPAAAASADPAGLAVWERTLDLCLALTAFGLELTRVLGPAYLPPPEEDS